MVFDLSELPAARSLSIASTRLQQCASLLYTWTPVDISKARHSALQVSLSAAAAVVVAE